MQRVRPRQRVTYASYGCICLRSLSVPFGPLAHSKSSPSIAHHLVFVALRPVGKLVHNLENRLNQLLVRLSRTEAENTQIKMKASGLPWSARMCCPSSINSIHRSLRARRFVRPCNLLSPTTPPVHLIHVSTTHRSISFGGSGTRATQTVRTWR